MKEQKITVLIVDDFAADRQFLKNLLAGQYEILEAENGRQALTELQEKGKKIGAVLLDLLMPEMDGFDFLSALKNTAWNRIPVIVMTVDREPEDEMRALNLGACDFVNKPYEPDILIMRLKNAISRSKTVLLEELQYMSEHDSLTGLYNMTKMCAEIRHMLDANPATKFTCMRVDIDRFRLMNTFWGEQEGDRLLKYIADLLREISSGYALCVYGRIHADIFCICIPYQERQLKKLINIIRMHVSAYNKDYVVQATFGIYVIDDPKISVENMYSRAAMASRECKKQYMAYVGYYDESMGERLLREQQIINEMQPALDRLDFVPYFQPKYNLKTGEPYGAEALVRWMHPQKGLIMPGTFIPVFERNGFIGKLDFYMWTQVCILLKKWMTAGMNPAPISVNISRVSMYNPNIVRILSSLVNKYDILPSMLNLELTESAYMDNPEIMKRAVQELQAAGFVIMMDDFGSGYSSLNTLKDIPVDVLKIDIKFLSDGSSDGRNERILASVIRMAGWLELPVVVEGVENNTQKDFLESIGCGYVQGFYFARPMPAADYETFICGSHQIPAFLSSENKKEIINAIWMENPQVELIFKSFQQPVAVYEFADNLFVPLRVNETFNEWFGYGENIIDANGNYQHHVTPEAFAIIIEAFEEAANTRGTAECEYLWTDRQNKKKWIRMNLKYLGRNEKEQILFATFNDETDRKNLEDTLVTYHSFLEGTDTRTMKILVVDDSELGREVVKTVFAEGYDILEAENGQEALNQLNVHGQDVVAIILDIMMPVMDGMQFLKRKNEIADIARIPVIVVSASDDEKDQINMLELGVNDYITKPFAPGVIKKRVQNVIEYNSRFHKLMEEYRKLLEMHSATKGVSKSRPEK